MPNSRFSDVGNLSGGEGKDSPTQSNKHTGPHIVKETKPPYSGAPGPTRTYPTIFKKVKTHAQSDGI